MHDVVERHHLLLEVLAERRRLHRLAWTWRTSGPAAWTTRVHAPELLDDPVDEGGGRARRRAGRAARDLHPAAVGLDVGRDRAGRRLVAAVGERRRRSPARPRSRQTAAPSPPLPPVTIAAPVEVAEVVHQSS